MIQHKTRWPQSRGNWFGLASGQNLFSDHSTHWPTMFLVSHRGPLNVSTMSTCLCVYWVCVCQILRKKYLLKKGLQPVCVSLVSIPPLPCTWCKPFQQAKIGFPGPSLWFSGHALKYWWWCYDWSPCQRKHQWWQESLFSGGQLCCPSMCLHSFIT